MSRYTTETIDIADLRSITVRGDDEIELEQNINSALVVISTLGGGVVTSIWLDGSDRSAPRKKDTVYIATIEYSAAAIEGLDAAGHRVYCYGARVLGKSGKGAEQVLDAARTAAMARAAADGFDFVRDTILGAASAKSGKFIEAVVVSGITGVFGANAIPVAASRTGFNTDTVLPEFGSSAAPERTDAISTSLELIEAAGVVIGTYTDEQGITCSVTGTYNPSTGAVSLTGTCGDWDVTITAVFNGSTLSGVNPTGGIVVARHAGGASSESRDWIASRGAAVVPTAAYYVDSMAGNDGNSGTSAALPKATLASAEAAGFGTGDTIRLARGSRWREALQAYGTGTTFESYGVGPRPILDCADIVTGGSWSATGGLTNVYETSFSAEDTPSASEAFIVLEDGVALTWVADTATCDSTPGSFTGTWIADPTTVYIHPRGSTVPADNGRTYEVSSRNHAIECSGSCTVRSIMTRANLHDNGSLVVRGSNDDTDAPLLWDCWALWGGKHNIYDCGTADLSRGVRHCVALYWMPGATTADAFVTFRDTVTDGAIHPVHYDCAAIGHPGADVLTVGGAAGRNGAGAYIAHLGATPGGDYGTSYIEDFGAAYCSGFFSLRGPWSINVTNLLSERQRGGSAHVEFNLLGGTITASRMRLYNHEPGYNSDRRLIRSLSQSNGSISDSIFTSSISVNGGGAVQLFGTVALQRNLMRRLNSAGTVRWVRTLDGAATVTQSECVYFDGINAFYLDVAGSVLTASDYNVVHHPTGDLTVQESSAATLRGFPVYQGDQSLDQNSTNSGPTYEVDTDNGAWGGRPEFIETAASESTRGYQCGPEPSRSNGSGWTVPATYAAARAFADTLAMPVTTLTQVVSHNADFVTVDTGADSWPDLTGSGNTPVQAIAGKQPAIVADELNGHQVLRFVGPNSIMEYPGNVSASTSFTLYVVAKRVGADNYQFLLDASAGRSIVGWNVRAPDYYDTAWRGNAPIGDTEWHLLRWELDASGGTGTIYEDGVQVGSGTWAGNTIQGTVVLGARNDDADNWATADWARFEIFEGVHSAVESAAVEAYLLQWAGL